MDARLSDGLSRCPARLASRVDLAATNGWKPWQPQQRGPVDDNSPHRYRLRWLTMSIIRNRLNALTPLGADYEMDSNAPPSNGLGKPYWIKVGGRKNGRKDGWKEMRKDGRK